LTGYHLEITNLPPHGVVFHGFAQFGRFIHQRMILLVTSFSIIDALSQLTVFEAPS
jgi:multidrug efflux pump subunit AcrB